MKDRHVDIVGFQNMTGLDITLTKELYDIFIDEMVMQNQNLERSFTEGDFEELLKIIHDLKGIADSYRADYVYFNLIEVEKKLKRNDLTNLITYIEKLSEDMDAAVEEIHSLFREKGKQTISK